jgi:hypothetical protein
MDAVSASFLQRKRATTEGDRALGGGAVDRVDAFYGVVAAREEKEKAMWTGERSTSTTYEIRVEGVLSHDWSDWLGGLTITTCKDRETLIAGAVPDQAALFGILAQLHALNMTLIAVQRVPAPVQGG